MLILTRKANESLVIGDTVTVTVLEVRGGQVRIGIDAPREVQVYRKEIRRDDEARRRYQNRRQQADE